MEDPFVKLFAYLFLYGLAVCVIMLPVAWIINKFTKKGFWKTYFMAVAALLAWNYVKSKFQN